MKKNLNKILTLSALLGFSQTGVVDGELRFNANGTFKMV
jgi:hypothetical protein